jgi:malonate transporter and related proteins
VIQVIGLLLPIFALIALGYVAVRQKWIDTPGIRGINDFTVRFAFPALLFGSIVNATELDTFGIAGIYLVGCLAVYGLAFLIACLALHAHFAHGAAFALNATYGNAAYAGMPIIATMFGAPGVSQIVPIIALHTGVLLPLATILIEIGAHNDGTSAVFRGCARRLARNPIVMSIVFGFLWRAANLPFAFPVSDAVTLLSKAAPPLALFCVGASLPTVAGGSVKEAVLAAVLKLGVLPLSIWFLAVLAGVSGLPLKVALVTAAMPTGVNAFLVAQRAGPFAETSARVVVVSLIVSLPVLSGLLIGLR